VRIKGVIASSASTDLGSRFYVTESNRTTGIQIYTGSTSLTINRGDNLDIIGKLSQTAGERKLINPVVTINPQP
jgi:hypothetical protein